MACLIRDAALAAHLCGQPRFDGDRAPFPAMRIFSVPMKLIHTFADPVELDGKRYLAKVFGDEQWDGCWHAYVVFVPDGKRSGLVATERDCVAPNLTALSWWASGLTGDYLRHALKRALFLEHHPEERTEEAPALRSR